MSPLNDTILPLAYIMDFDIIYILFGESSISMNGKQKIISLKRSFDCEYTPITIAVFLKELVDFYCVLSSITFSCYC